MVVKMNSQDIKQERKKKSIFRQDTFKAEQIGSLGIKVQQRGTPGNLPRCFLYASEMERTYWDNKKVKRLKMLMSVCEKTMGRASRKRIEKTKSDIIPFIDKRRQLNYGDKTEKKIGQETAIFYFFLTL